MSEPRIKLPKSLVTFVHNLMYRLCPSYKSWTMYIKHNDQLAQELPSKRKCSCTPSLPFSLQDTPVGFPTHMCTILVAATRQIFYVLPSPVSTCLCLCLFSTKMLENLFPPQFMFSLMFQSPKLKAPGWHWVLRTIDGGGGVIQILVYILLAKHSEKIDLSPEFHQQYVHILLTPKSDSLEQGT